MNNYIIALIGACILAGCSGPGNNTTYNTSPGRYSLPYQPVLARAASPTVPAFAWSAEKALYARPKFLYLDEQHCSVRTEWNVQVLVRYRGYLSFPVRVTAQHRLPRVSDENWERSVEQQTEQQLVNAARMAFPDSVEARGLDNYDRVDEIVGLLQQQAEHYFRALTGTNSTIVVKQPTWFNG